MAHAGGSPLRSREPITKAAAGERDAGALGLPLLGARLQSPMPSRPRSERLPTQIVNP
jgi:hypothetical protein